MNNYEIIKKWMKYGFYIFLIKYFYKTFANKNLLHIKWNLSSLLICAIKMKFLIKIILSF